MRGLLGIADQIHHLIRTVSTNVELEMIVIDSKFNRISHTYPALPRTTGPRWDGAVMRHVLNSHGEMVVAVKGADRVCTTCPYNAACSAQSVLMVPIRSCEHTLGVIGFEAWSDRQKALMLNRREALRDLLRELAAAISIRVEAAELAARYRDNQRRLDVLASLPDTLLLELDRGGQVTWANQAATRRLAPPGQRLLGRSLTDVWPGFPLSDVSTRGAGARPITAELPGARERVRCWAESIREGRQTSGTIVALRTAAGGTPAGCARPVPRVTSDSIIGESPQIRRLRRLILRISRMPTTVLLRGESGTGKELVAQVIHCESDRRNGPFVPVNCAAIPDALLESELFGYEEGAFTGARRGGKPGRFEQASGGTIFLDEIGDMPVHLQTKLLRVVEERAVEPVGSTQYVPVDIRVIAATHRDLEEMVRAGRFREDLYYRLSVVPVFLPPLRERVEDIPPLCDAFIRRSGMSKHLIRFSDAAMSVMKAYSWPGNARELQNVVEYGIGIAEGDIIDVGDLPERLRTPEAAAPSLRELENEVLLKALARFGSDLRGKKRAAEALGISLSTLYRKMKRLQVASGRTGSAQQDHSVL